MKANIRADDNTDESDEGMKDDDDDDNDFFTNKSISTKEIFNKIQNEKKANHPRGRGGHYDTGGDELIRSKKPDKSRGFQTQNQSKREYRVLVVCHQLEQFNSSLSLHFPKIYISAFFPQTFKHLLV